jgi:type 1 glutamine amidotransferase
MKIKPLLPLVLLAAALTGVAIGASAASAPKPIRVLLVTGGCCHNYQLQGDTLKQGLEARANVQVDVYYTAGTAGTRTVFALYQDPDWAKGYDLILHDECSADVVDMPYIQRIMAPHAAGLPAVFLHCAMHCFRTEGWNVAGTITPWFELTGLQTTGHTAQAPISMTYFDKSSAITKGLENWVTGDEELYNNPMGGILPTAHAVALGRIGAETNVIAWTNIYKGKARTFATTLGHNDATVMDPRYLDLVTRGLLWAANKLGDESYLKPAPKVAPAVPQKMSKTVAPAADHEDVEVESTGCGCQDSEPVLAMAD